MKIRTRLTWQYTLVTAVVFLLTILSVSLYSEYVRSEAFYRTLKREAVTKAHLFLEGKVDAVTMQSVYQNNRHFLDEVEVAVYRLPFEMIYHDAVQSDRVKETPEMLAEIASRGELCFEMPDYQGVGIDYVYGGQHYILTAAAYDGHGLTSQQLLEEMLLALAAIGLLLLLIVGYYLSGYSLRPVQSIVQTTERISARNIGRRLPVGTQRDELTELSETINGLLERLEQAFNAQKMFVSNVSHELRTPLAALRAELELTLLKPRTPERYAQSVNNALQDTLRLSRLVDGLLNLAKADYQPESIKMEEVRLDEILLDAREMVRRGHPAYQIELVFDSEAEDDSVLTVRGNSYLLTTAFVNLMENNCKFSANQTSLVQIGYWQDMAYLRFSDSGTGISDADRYHLFTPFYRGENRDMAQGHGVGMALVHKILTLHEGEIEVHSHPGEGTTFIVKMKHL